MASRKLIGAMLGFWLVALVIGLSVTSAEEPNVGVLRVAGVKHARQVAPSAQVSFVIEVEYAIRLNATIKASLYEGSQSSFGQELWHSEPVIATGGGDKVWTFSLTAPSAEGSWLLTVFAYFQESGKWKYYNDSEQGPGYSEIALKIARLANLEINLGATNIPVTIENSTQRTSAFGKVNLQLPVGQAYVVSVPSALPLENSTKLVFLGWQDGNKYTQRTVMLDGDSRLVGSYGTQYLLRVNSIVPKYSYSGWYDPGSNVTLQADSSVPLNWPFGSLGLKYVFKGWSGAAESRSTVITLTINEPKVVSADFAVDYTPLVLPTILGAGIVGGLVLSIARRRSGSKVTSVEEEGPSEAASTNLCENCGKPIEESWTHCVNCGKTLRSAEPLQS